MSGTQLIADNVEARLAISVSDIVPTTKIYKTLNQVMNKFPSTELILEKEILSGEKMLANGQVNLAIFEGLKNRKDFTHRKIGDLILKLVIASEHPFLKLPQKKQTLKNLYKYPQIVQRSTLKDDTLNIGVHKESVKWKVSDTSSKYEIISQGLGWGRLPCHIIQNDLESGKLAHLSHLKDDDEVEVFLCRRNETQLGQVSEFIWNAL